MLQDPYTRLHCEFLDCGAIDLSIAGGAPLDVNRPSTPHATRAQFLKVMVLLQYLLHLRKGERKVYMHTTSFQIQWDIRLLHERFDCIWINHSIAGANRRGRARGAKEVTDASDLVDVPQELPEQSQTAEKEKGEANKKSMFHNPDLFRHSIALKKYSIA